MKERFWEDEELMKKQNAMDDERDVKNGPENGADRVNHPSHYCTGGVECIDAIRAALGEGFVGYCQGNSIKYLWRWRHKGGLEDLKKAQVYLGWMIEAVESGDACKKAD